MARSKSARTQRTAARAVSPIAPVPVSPGSILSKLPPISDERLEQLMDIAASSGPPGASLELLQCLYELKGYRRGVRS